MERALRNAPNAPHVALQPQSEHLFAIDFVSNVSGMRNASAHTMSSTPHPQRPRLALVPDGAPRTPAPRRQRLAALLAGLVCGFAMAALAAVVGGAGPGAPLGIAAALAVALVAVLVHARRIAVRDLRAARARRARRQGATVTSLDIARAA